MRQFGPGAARGGIINTAVRNKSADKPFSYKAFAAACVALVAVTLGIYWQTLGFGFLNFDDDAYVTNNPLVKAGLSASAAARAFTTPVSSNWHPLTVLSHMLDVELFGLDAGYHHLVNVLLHCANAVLLMLFLTMATGRLWRSAFAAALFAAHPLHVESVAWVSERKDVLSTFFLMLTLLAYLRYARKRTVPAYALVVTLFALGLMAKPMLVTLPILLLIIDYWPLGRFQTSGVRTLVLEKLPLLVLSAISSAATIWAQHAGGAMSGLEAFPLGVRLANAAVSYVSYIGKMIWPARLAVFYPHPGASLAAWQVVVSSFALILITAWAAYCRKSRPYVAAGWLWYAAGLIPVSGIVQVGAQGMADRYTYVPMIGLFAAITWAVPEPRHRVLRSALVLAAFVIIAALALCSFFQVGHWRSDEALFARAVKVGPPNAFAYAHLAVAVRDKGDLDTAISLFSKAADMAPQNARVQRELGAALMKQGLLPEALEHLEAAVQLDPSDAAAHTTAAVTLAMLGRLDESLPHFRKAAGLKPRESIYRANLGQCLFLLGKPLQAEQEFMEALRLDPGNATAAANYSRLLAQMKRTGEARLMIGQAMKTAPDDPEVRRTAEQVLKQIGSK